MFVCACVFVCVFERILSGREVIYLGSLVRTVNRKMCRHCLCTSLFKTSGSVSLSRSISLFRPLSPANCSCCSSKTVLARSLARSLNFSPSLSSRAPSLSLTRSVPLAYMLPLLKQQQPRRHVPSLTHSLPRSYTHKLQLQEQQTPLSPTLPPLCLIERRTRRGY